MILLYFWYDELQKRSLNNSCKPVSLKIITLAKLRLEPIRSTLLEFSRCISRRNYQCAFLCALVQALLYIFLVLLMQDQLMIFETAKFNGLFAVPRFTLSLFQALKASQRKNKFKFPEFSKVFGWLVSGSAALPVTVMGQWHQTQVTIARADGNDEIGMAIKFNPYSESERAGHIGQALPGVKLTVDESN